MSGKIYMAGCGGMLGAAFHAVFGKVAELRCTDIDVNENWLQPLDFRNLAAYRADVERFQPSMLFHLGAITSLEDCERDPDTAYGTNTLAVENAVYIANRLDIPLLYISTAGIFDGKQALYDDWDTPAPLGVYARSKFAGERFVVENARRHVVARAGWMMGGGPRKDKKFVQKLMKQIKAGATVLHVVDDKDGTPTYTYDFARNVQRVLDAEVWGLYNMVCHGETSRLEVARELVSILGLSGRIEVRPVSSDHFKQEYFAARPPSERLVNRKLALRGLDTMRDWRVALREYLAEAYAGYLD